MSQDLSTTSYALLGLLVFDGPSSKDGLTGYELKRRADNTLRFYWVAPAMSQVYTELNRLARLELVTASLDQAGRRATHRYRISARGSAELERWLVNSEPEFPVLKHPVALRLLMGGLVGPERVRELLDTYLDQLAERNESLLAVRASLGDIDALKYPAMVADWGLSYYDSEASMVRQLRNRLPTSGPGAG
ncbi:MAG: PadR family transcriptional regulator [Propionibacteriaceae bacterium]|nr:PadR family transcriptional regulator [Propionibacteriaceae bacterium]